MRNHSRNRFGSFARPSVDWCDCNGCSLGTSNLADLWSSWYSFCGRYDFTRFTDLGHRCPFRGSQEIDRGLVCGPWMALALSNQFILSFTYPKSLRKLTRLFARLTAFFLKYFGCLLLNSPVALDVASGLFFTRRKLEPSVECRELLNTYRGADWFFKGFTVYDEKYSTYSSFTSGSYNASRRGGDSTYADIPQYWPQ